MQITQGSVTEAEEDSNHSSLDTSATTTAPSTGGGLFSLSKGSSGRTGSNHQQQQQQSPQLEEHGAAAAAAVAGGAGGGGEGGGDAEGQGLAMVPFQPPDEGTPAAEALAANAAIPRTRVVGMMRSGSGKRPKFNKKLGRHLKKKKRRNFQGNVIKGEHEQYTLTIGMMLGIRVAVGRPQQMDDLTLMDFMQVDKYLFPPKGCNKPPHRTPPHHLSHDFKFKDYAPKIFHRIRQLFGIDSASYMLSVSGNYNYLEFMSNSKSGQFFFYSHDGRFMIKTQTPEENKFLRKILPHYYQYVSLNPNTLLTRFYGMHRVKMRHLKRKVHFVIMHSVFDTKEKIYRIYDLKGSTVGRSSGPDKVRKEGVVYKDLDLVDDQVKFQLGTKRKLFMEQLEKDASFLASLNIMDYSLLIGIHDKTRADDSLERNHSVSGSVTGSGGRGGGGGGKAGSVEEMLGSTGGLVEPDEGGALPLHHHPAHQPPLKGGGSYHNPHGSGGLPTLPPYHGTGPRSRREYSYESSGKEEGVHSAGGYGECDEENYQSYDESDFDSEASDSDEDDIPLPPSMVGAGFSQQSHSGFSNSSDRPPLGLPTEASILTSATNERRLTHRRDHGVQSRLLDGSKGNEIYFVGVIDILQQYNAFKRAETFLKSFKYDSRQISAVDPKWYARRFVEFTSHHIQ